MFFTLCGPMPISFGQGRHGGAAVDRRPHALPDGLALGLGIAHRFDQTLELMALRQIAIPSGGRNPRHRDRPRENACKPSEV
jgi:hypothetical protein